MRSCSPRHAPEDVEHFVFIRQNVPRAAGWTRLSGSGRGALSRSLAAHIGGAGAVVVVVILATLSAFARQDRPLLSTVGSVAGTCHLDQDPFEFATLSDTSPAVPCDQPHQTETAFQLQVGGPLARRATRPNPELLEAAYSAACNDYGRIRSFLGARSPDVYWGVEIIARFPTLEEWANGVRTLDCAVYNNTPTGPSLTEDLAGILTRRDSAAFRLCRLGSALVTCNRPHDAEATSPNVVLAAGGWPGSEVEAAEAVHDCLAVVDAYLDAPLGSRPGLRIEPSALSEAQWTSGDRSVNCWIGVAGPPVVGTARGGLH